MPDTLSNHESTWVTIQQFISSHNQTFFRQPKSPENCLIAGALFNHHEWFGGYTNRPEGQPGIRQDAKLSITNCQRASVRQSQTTRVTGGRNRCSRYLPASTRIHSEPRRLTDSKPGLKPHPQTGGQAGDGACGSSTRDGKYTHRQQLLKGVRPIFRQTARNGLKTAISTGPDVPVSPSLPAKRNVFTSCRRTMRFQPKAGPPHFEPLGQNPHSQAVNGYPGPDSHKTPVLFALRRTQKTSSFRLVDIQPIPAEPPLAQIILNVPFVLSLCPLSVRPR
jgi:hypothetical protein